ncbi:5-oxoprolinase (ATP-hydrolyzing) (plasmid) [Rhizobium leguminosarum bv. trifolii WSM2304]|uniref:5-oxoprolinase (ATP-hydrolyzing) n=1 Tax=Rhizobium leguminosarum bv. trifolii (strain WSM2304) TaxID=395492 RepID=A0ABF7QZH0_RHILW|nr:hydantoinase B/oxoprolinase family protein [Rhizobium leguminosarum]ACI59646.1 5-oxoprolinase (ATP-hydrolyzing) [Rhizobium leguminosarum bv. trifolii WSM2304]
MFNTDYGANASDKHSKTEGPAVAGVDPITFSILLSRFNSIIEEMSATLERSAQSTMYSLCRDFDCVVLDAQARQIACGDALPVHTLTTHLVVLEIIKAFDGDINDGDVFLCNSSFHGNTHPADVATCTPVFYDGKLVFWSTARGHQLDIGAFLPSSVLPAAQNVYQEGITIPPLKLVDQGRMRKDVRELYFWNVRYRDLLEGDMLAQLGSIEKGKQRLLEICAEYGVATAESCIDALITYSNRRAKAEFAKIPDGVYHGQGWIDSDGVDVLDIPINVSVQIKNGDVVVDYEGSGPQARGGVNGSIATSKAAGAAPFMCYLPTDIPHNQGKIDAVTVKLPEGTIVNPHFPASTSCATIIPSDMMSDAVHKALSDVLPDRVMGGSTRCANVPGFAGEKDWAGRPWGVMLFNNTGGFGAAADNDGWPLCESVAALGGMRAQPLEQLEMLHPLLVDFLEIETDSMGYGKHIGGPGLSIGLRPLNGTIDCFSFGDGWRNPPHGVSQGTASPGGGQYVENLNTDQRRYFSATGNVKVAMDERYVGISCGGGGHGNPMDRDIELVRKNVRDGLISREVAASTFGVILDDGLDPKILEKETAARRLELGRSTRPSVEPVQPGTGRWAENHMREGDVFLLNPA